MEYDYLIFYECIGEFIKIIKIGEGIRFYKGKNCNVKKR